MKFKNSLVTEYERQEQEKRKQEQLKNKYNIDDNVVIVEKNNMAKFTINTVIRITKGIATIILILLAIIGLYSLIHPNIRTVLIDEFNNIIQQLKQLLNL